MFITAYYSHPETYFYICNIISQGRPSTKNFVLLPKQVGREITGCNLKSTLALVNQASVIQRSCKTAGFQGRNFRHMISTIERGRANFYE